MYCVSDITKNQFMGALSEDARRRVFPNLKRVEMHSGDVVCDPLQDMKYVYFPVNGVISMLYDTLDGHSTQVAVIGREGALGLFPVMSGKSSPSRLVVQNSGYAYRMSAATFCEEFNDCEEFRMLCLRFIQALMAQTSQMAVCNRHHCIDQQLCRWLLFSLDRLEDNRIKVTQEWIANSLGVRRESVTEAACKLQKLGAIRYQRGMITVLNRSLLEERCCECYEVVKQETDELMSPNVKR